MEFLKKYWWIVLIIVIVVFSFFYFKKKADKTITSAGTVNNPMTLTGPVSASASAATNVSYKP